MVDTESTGSLILARSNRGKGATGEAVPEKPQRDPVMSRNSGAKFSVG